MYVNPQAIPIIREWHVRGRSYRRKLITCNCLGSWSHIWNNGETRDDSSCVITFRRVTLCYALLHRVTFALRPLCCTVLHHIAPCCAMLCITAVSRSRICICGLAHVRRRRAYVVHYVKSQKSKRQRSPRPPLHPRCIALHTHVTFASRFALRRYYVGIVFRATR